MDGYVLERMQGSRGCGYLFPAGSGPLEPVLSALEQDAAERGEPCRFFCVTPEQARLLEEIRPGRYRLEPDRDGWDYLYDVDRLADLAGKKLHGKRNHIRRFEEEHPDWRAEEITVENLGECAAMDLEWNRLYRTGNGDAEKEAQTRLDERHAMSKAFAFYEQLGLAGLLIRCQGQVVAFTMGSLINPETVDVHFEKAYGEIQGAYPIINREFARWIREHRPQVPPDAGKLLVAVEVEVLGHHQGDAHHILGDRDAIAAGGVAEGDGFRQDARLAVVVGAGRLQLEEF